MEQKDKEKIINSFQVLTFGRTEVGTPKIDEVFGRDEWIKYGVNNDYPQELLRLYQNSSGLHSALLKRKADMIAGLGFQNSTGLAPFIKNALIKEDLNKIAYKCAFDLVIFGGYYLNIVWDANGKYIAKIKHIPFEKVRVQKPQDEAGDVTGYYISRDWLAPKKKENRPVLIPAFDQEDEQGKVYFPSQLLGCKMYSPGMDYYTVPNYHPCLNYIKLAFEISNFHLKSAQHGYMPGLIVSIPNMPGEEERKLTSDNIKARSGTDEVNKTVVVYYEGDVKPEFTPLNTNTNDQKYKDVVQILNEEIFIGHNANSTIAGIATAGKLGASNEIKDAYAHFQKTVIAPLQGELESTFNSLASINNISDKMALLEYAPYKEEPTAAPLSGTTAPIN